MPPNLACGNVPPMGMVLINTLLYCTFSSSSLVSLSNSMSSTSAALPNFLDHHPQAPTLSHTHMHLLIALARSYATASTRSSRIPSTKPPLSLDHFLLRQRVISLYRTIIRACHKIPPPTREEMKKFAREEFEQHKAVEDLRKIRYLLSTGKTDFERLGKQVSGMG